MPVSRDPTNITTELQVDVSETVTFSDDVNALPGYVRSAAETVTFSDGVTRVKTHFVAIAETVSISSGAIEMDHGPVINVELLIDLDDSVTFSDEVTGVKTVPYQRDMPETVSFSAESITISKHFTRTVSESISISSTTGQSTGNVYTKDMTESWSVGETITRVLVAGRGMTESVTISPVTEHGNNIFSRSADNTITFLDILSRGNVVFRGRMTETVTISELIAGLSLHTITESITFTDSITRTIPGTSRGLAETVTFSGGVYPTQNSYYDPDIPLCVRNASNTPTVYVSGGNKVGDQQVPRISKSTLYL